MKLTVDVLKQESCNFDLECVFVLDLTNKGIRDLGNIKDCLNLEILNLSLNEISDLTSLRGLNKLQFLNLSFNHIKNLDGLEGLENVKTINLSGNSVECLEEFNKLKNMDNLTHLILHDSKTTATNPVCTKYKNYKNELNKMLPKLESIDGESFKLSNKKLFKNLDETLSELAKDSTSIDDRDLITCSEPWLDNKLLTSSLSKNSKNSNNNHTTLAAFHNSLDEEREKFKNLYEEISKTIQTTNQTVIKVDSGLKSINI